MRKPWCRRAELCAHGFHLATFGHVKARFLETSKTKMQRETDMKCQAARVLFHPTHFTWDGRVALSTSEIKRGFGGQDPSVWRERPGDGIHGVTVSHLLPVQGPPELLDQGMELSVMTLSPEA